MGSICNHDMIKQTPAGGGNSFTVTVGKKEVVAAAFPMQEHWLPLSNLDLLLPPFDVGVFFCYSSASPAAVGKLKKGLAQALVAYYVFAGEVVMNSGGEPEILCNNCGVEFCEAYADVELRELDLYNPDDAVEGKLVPVKKHGVFAVQATELRCGGIIVGCSFDHRIADAYSCNMFLVAWAELTQSKAISSPPPSFHRSVLNPRRPLKLDPTLDDMYVSVSALPPPPSPPSSVLLSRIYHVKYEDLAILQSTTSRTKLVSFSALLWQLVAKSSRQPDAVSKMGIVVDGRSRLTGVNDMSRYFGNVLSITLGGRRVGELVESSVSHVADGVHEFLEKGTSEDHFLDLIDWVEARRPKPAVSRINGSGTEGPAFVISSGQRFPVREVDFGWGRPVFGSYHFPWGGSAGYVMPMPSPKKGSGDWVVYMHLSEEQLDVIEKEGASVFRPFSWDYVM
ncbi:Coniferyl alcohol acyltransferase [Linum grandiflorum]